VLFTGAGNVFPKIFLKPTIKKSSNLLYLLIFGRTTLLNCKAIMANEKITNPVK
jgi:hypothetical protein